MDKMEVDESVNSQETTESADEKLSEVSGGSTGEETHTTKIPFEEEKILDSVPSERRDDAPVEEELSSLPDKSVELEKTLECDPSKMTDNIMMEKESNPPPDKSVELEQTLERDIGKTTADTQMEEESSELPDKSVELEQTMECDLGKTTANPKTGEESSQLPVAPIETDSGLQGVLSTTTESNTSEAHPSVPTPQLGEAASLEAETAQKLETVAPIETILKNSSDSGLQGVLSTTTESNTSEAHASVPTPQIGEAAALEAETAQTLGAVDRIETVLDNSSEPGLPTLSTTTEPNTSEAHASVPTLQPDEAAAFETETVQTTGTVMMSPDRHSHSDSIDACVDDELGLLAEATGKSFDEDEEEPEESSDGNLDDDGIDEDDYEDESNHEEDADEAAESPNAEQEEMDTGEDPESDEIPADGDNDKSDNLNITISAVAGNIGINEESVADSGVVTSKEITDEIIEKDVKPDIDLLQQTDMVEAAEDGSENASEEEKQLDEDEVPDIRVEILATDDVPAAEMQYRPAVSPPTDKPPEEEMTFEEDTDFAKVAKGLKVNVANVVADENLFDVIMQSIADKDIDVKVKIRTPEPVIEEQEPEENTEIDQTASDNADKEGDEAVDTLNDDKESGTDYGTDDDSDFKLQMGDSDDTSDTDSEADSDTQEALMKKKKREDKKEKQRSRRAEEIIQHLKDAEKQKNLEKEAKLKETQDEIEKQLSEIDKFISDNLEKSFIEKSKSIKLEKVTHSDESQPKSDANEPNEKDLSSSETMQDEMNKDDTVSTKETALIDEDTAKKVSSVIAEPATQIEVTDDIPPAAPEAVPVVDVPPTKETIDVEKPVEATDVREPEPMDTSATADEIPPEVKDKKDTIEEPVAAKPKRNRLRLDDRTPTEVLDLESDEEGGGYKRKEKCYICVNASCTTPSDGKWINCPMFVLSYFKVKRTRKVQQKVCEDCFEEVILHYERLANCLPSGEPICAMDHKVKHTEFVEISDSESESEGETDFTSTTGLMMEDQEFISDNLINEINNAWNKYKMQKQVDMFAEDLRLNLERVEKDTDDLNTLFTKLQNTMDTIAMNLYQGFKPDGLEQGDIFIDGTEPGESNTDIQTSLVEEALKLQKEAEDSSIAAQDLGDDAEVSVVRQDIEHAPRDLPPPGELKLRVPKVDDVIFGVKKSAFGAWGKAHVLEVWPKGSTLPSGAVSTFTICRVRFDSKTKPNQLMKSLTGRQIAIAETVPVRLDVGTRVVAMFKDQDNVYKDDVYYSGVIAEPPKPVNGFRYLVFFDDGYAQYAEHSRLLVVCEHSLRVWEDVHPDSRDFVRKYLQAYPERPMVRLQRGQQLKTEWNGSWWWCTVVDVDASLAKIAFPEGRQEWVYRGSTRLAPLYRELATLPGQAPGTTVQGPAAVPELAKDVTQMPPPAAQGLPILARGHATSRRSVAARGGLNVPYVEYTNADKDLEPEDSEANKVRRHVDAGGVTSQPPKKQAVAKKSVTNVAPQPPPSQPVSKKPEGSDQFTSRVVYYAPKSYVRPHKMVPHKCSFKCQRTDVLPLRAIKNYNPLAKPILAGWERLFEKFRGRRMVLYRAPCGRRLRSAQELHQYLRAIESDMSIDLFSFDPNVHCLGEFVLNKCFAIKKDITQGRENIPIPCVNYYDDKLPEFCVYSTTRTPTRGVNLNLSDDFLCGCDCTDDCLDKSKCQCWQLTYDGARFMGITDLGKVGYNYKRLPETVPTGIYECNARCKCSKTCLNRVVQHPLQLKLQVFKTYNRGWGIRALNDLPKGTFICVYAGNLLTDATANEDGLIEGDEYLAELDYIEVVENLKNDYEADIPEEDKELDRRNIGKPSTSKGRNSKSRSTSEVDEESEKSDADEDIEKRSYEQDHEFRPDYNVNTGKKNMSMSLRARREKDRSRSKDSDKDKGVERIDQENNIDNDLITISDDEDAREPSRFAAPAGLSDENISKHISVRTFFGEDEACYIMDAKVQGNIGRYLNHSCCPNVFVQNVFVDTHDPRFPWVAFFALSYIRAGTELTWNYNYDVGSVHGKVILCKCGANSCRGRLL